MSAFKRKRGGQNRVDKKAKKGKFVPDKDYAPNGDEQRKTEATIPPPVSMVNAVHIILYSCSLLANANIIFVVQIFVK